jgi:hypothetical protein
LVGRCSKPTTCAGFILVDDSHGSGGKLVALGMILGVILCDFSLFRENKNKMDLNEKSLHYISEVALTGRTYRDH